MLDSGGNRLDDCEVTNRLQMRTSKHLIKDNIGWDTNIFQRPGQGVFRVPKTQGARINWQIKSILSDLVTWRLYFFEEISHEMAKIAALQKLILMYTLTNFLPTKYFCQAKFVQSVCLNCPISFSTSCLIVLVVQDKMLRTNGNHCGRIAQN